MTMVSIIMPVYNSLPYLEASYASVMGQTFRDFELIIVDDGSTDAFDDWVRRIDDDRVTVLRQENSGASAARNTGIRRARGGYIAFIDADDLWLPEKLAKQIEALEGDRDAGLVYTHVASIDAEGKSRHKTYRYRKHGWVWKDLLRENFLVCGSTPMVRRECFDIVGLFDTQLMNCNDRDMWIRIARHYRFTCVPEVLVQYRQYDTSLSMQYEQREKSIVRFLTKAYGDPPEGIGRTELDRIVNRAYSQSFNVLAWKPLQSEPVNVRGAARFFRKSLRSNPRYAFSRDTLRLAASLLIVAALGRPRYDALRRRFRRLFG